MNEKITLPTIIQLLALRTGDTCSQAEEFIRELIAVISDGLQAGDQIKIKEFGIFKTIAVEARKSVNVSTGEDYEIPAHRKVVFIPSREVAALINAPFEMFDTVELSDGVEFDIENSDFTPIADADDEGDEETIEGDQASFKCVEEEDVCVSDEETGELTGNDAASEDVEKEEPVENAADSDEESGLFYEAGPELEDIEAEEYGVGESGGTMEPEDEPNAVARDEDEYDSVEPGVRPHRFLYGFLSGFGAAALIGMAIFFCVRYFNWDKSIVPVSESVVSTDNLKPDTIMASDPDTVPIVQSGQNRDSTGIAGTPDGIPGHTVNGAEVPTMPSDRKVYDTITKTRYLTTMAKDHYGNFNLWPYIYKENEAFLGHPDRIRPGTQVVVPPLSKYGVDPANPADIAKAKRLGVEIYSRYK